MRGKAAVARALDIKTPDEHDWRTTDEDEINKRRLRAQREGHQISNTDSKHPIFSNFRVLSTSGLFYSVEIRDLRARSFSCDCVDFRKNGLGTCKHVEAVLLYLEARHRRLFRRSAEDSSARIDAVPDQAGGKLRIERGLHALPPRLRVLFDADGLLLSESMERTVELLTEASLPNLRISQDVAPWLDARRREEERVVLRREYEQKVQSGEWPQQETLVPLYPYQREGMLHLAFTERALLADEMGLGKTIQAIAACALLHRLGKASRILVVTPASLKAEWEEQIRRYTLLPYQIVFGSRQKRLQNYVNPPFFTIVNYEQMIADSLDVNRFMNPDIVILDEAQRIKNWSTKTAQAVKRLQSRYAFVLTGTPIENRIDELYSLMDFLNPIVLGPLFRFNREFYELDFRGRPTGYRNLDLLHARIKPYLVRRRKADVETELPDRSDRTHFVPLSSEQKNTYGDHEREAARLVQISLRRPLTQREQEKLLMELSMMRMICDTNYILDPDDRVCPKLTELKKILEECKENPEIKVLIFSEWERMLHLVRELCERLDLGYAYHTGTVPQKKRRGEILLFKNDPECRVFLSTDSGSTGLNLQSASVVINCDLPWNPARLEQRIARAWRKHQMRPVTVINLVSENTLEHRMIATLAVKQALAEGVLDLKGDLKEIPLTSGRQSFLARLRQLMAEAVPQPAPEKKALPPDRALAFSRTAHEKLKDALVLCEERYPLEGAHSVLVVVVDRDAGVWQEKLAPLHQELFGAGHSDPLAPTNLEVIDRATHEALKRLTDAGLILSATRAKRPLYPPETAATEPVLSEEERRKAAEHRAQAQRKLKMARLLGAGEMIEETREALFETVLSLGRAFAIEHKMPEPKEVKEVLLAPLSIHWKNKLPTLQDFVSNPSAPWNPLADHLQQMV